MTQSLTRLKRQTNLRGCHEIRKTKFVLCLPFKRQQDCNTRSSDCSAAVSTNGLATTSSEQRQNKCLELVGSFKKPYLDKHKMDNRKKLQPNGASQKREVYSQENNVTTVIFQQKNVSQSELGRYTD